MAVVPGLPCFSQCEALIALGGPPPRRWPNLRLHALLTALLVTLGFLVVPVAASAAQGDVGVEGPSHAGTGTPTGTKRATSALWFNDGFWWGNLWDTASSDFHIFRFNAATSSWVDTGVATDTRAKPITTCCGTGQRCMWRAIGSSTTVCRLSPASRRRCGVTATTPVQTRIRCSVPHRSTTQKSRP